jgi:hypothetical protein
MKKFVNIIKKSREITKRFMSVVRNKRRDGDDDDRNDNKHRGNKHREDELDDHNDSSNWTYN